MPKVRKEIPELEKLVQVGRKKFVRYEEGVQLYSMGLHTFQELAKFFALHDYGYLYRTQDDFW